MGETSISERFHFPPAVRMNMYEYKQEKKKKYKQVRTLYQERAKASSTIRVIITVYLINYKIVCVSVHALR